jgi:hypothetical protein
MLCLPSPRWRRPTLGLSPGGIHEPAPMFADKDFE